MENVLFIVLDTVRRDRLAPYSDTKQPTPELASFSDEFAVYDNAVSQAPWTLPSHGSMFTGLYPSEHQATQEDPYLNDDVDTVAERLSNNGYATACYTSNAWITPYTGMTRGFDRKDNFFQVLPQGFLDSSLNKIWKRVNSSDRLRSIADRAVQIGNFFHERFASSGGGDSKTPTVVDNTIDFIDEQDSEWFAFVNLMDAHLPYYPPEKYREKFSPDVDPDKVCQNSKEYNAGARDIDDDEWEDIKRLYDAEIAHMDAELGRLFGWLQDEGYWNDTTVIVCSDHGELHGEHDLYGHEFCIYDPLVNVPLMIKHPNVEADHHADQVEMRQLFHTILDATDVDSPDASLLTGSSAEQAFVEYHRPVVELQQLESKASSAGNTLSEQSRFYSRMRAVRRPDAKYIRNERIDDEFYLLEDDPAESDNRVNDDAVSDRLNALSASLDDFVDDMGSWGSVDNDDPLDGLDDDAKDRLRDLGYME